MKNTTSKVLKLLLFFIFISFFEFSIYSLPLILFIIFFFFKFVDKTYSSSRFYTLKITLKKFIFILFVTSSLYLVINFSIVVYNTFQLTHYTKSSFTAILKQTLLEYIDINIGKVFKFINTPTRAVSLFLKDDSYINTAKESALYFKKFNIERVILSIPINNNYNTNKPSLNVSESTITTIITYLESLGYEVVLKCHNTGIYDDIGNQGQPSNKDMWFSNYSKIIDSLSDIAYAFNHSYFIISNEMGLVSNVSSNKSSWIEIINLVKDKDLLVGASLNMPEIFGQDKYQLFEELDFYGLNLYPSLSNESTFYSYINPTHLYHSFYKDLHGYETIPLIKELDSSGKDIWITETGSMPSSNALNNPAYWGSDSGDYNETTQKIYLNSIMYMFSELHYIDTLALWNANLDDPFCVAGKEAEKVLLKYWR